MLGKINQLRLGIARRRFENSKIATDIEQYVDERIRPDMAPPKMEVEPRKPTATIRPAIYRHGSYLVYANGARPNP